MKASRGVAGTSGANTSSRTSAELTATADVYTTEIVRAIFGREIGAVVGDYSCTHNKRSGRIYVATNAICFYSNLFGFEKKIKIPYSHVTCVTKENTAVFIPNAIAVITARKEYVFRSFWDRDDCFNLLRAYHEMYRTVLEPASSHVEEEETQQQEPQKEEEKFETHVETPVARQESLPSRTS